MSEHNINGFAADGWDRVRVAFEANFAAERSEEIGAGVAVYHRGRLVVDLTGGWFDAARTIGYGPDTLQLVFSTTKGIAALSVAICADRGLLDYAMPVAQYWPEFAAAGKADITVAQLLSHQAGLVTLDGPVSLGEALDWEWMVEHLGAAAPLWPLGEGHGYHAITFGWLAGELVRRVDPQHRGIGQFVREEIAEPLGVEMYIGLPSSLEPRVSPIVPAAPPTDPAVLALMLQVMGPETLGGRALSLNGAFSEPGMVTFNRPEVHAAEIAGAAGITNAPSLARMYAAAIGDVDDVRLFSAETMERVRATVTPNGEPDKCLVMPTTFGMGFMTHGLFTPYAGPGSFGHPGAGGSVAFAHPEHELGFAYVMNQMAGNLANDPRSANLIAAALACTG